MTPKSRTASKSPLDAHINALSAQGVDVAPDASARRLHNGIDTPLPPADLHGSYANHRPQPTEGIKDRRAFIVGSGIAGLSAAFFLIRDGHMPAENIEFIDEQPIDGGSLDGSGNPEDGYLVRGGREMEVTYQNFWDVFSEIPALELPKPFSVLDEFRLVNDADKNFSKARLLEKQGQIKDSSTMGLTRRQQLEVIKLLLARKEDLDNVTVEEWFSKGFLNSNFYMFWRTMFAFQNWHSALEMKLYMHRFLHLMDGLNDMTSLVFPKYNQYDGFVRPLSNWLKEQGVHIRHCTRVTNLKMTTNNGQRTVSGILCHTIDGDKTIEVREGDVVFVTTGSMTEDTAYGDDDTAPQLKDTVKPGAGSGWQLWKNLAGQSEVFGRPDTFCGNVPRSTWESVTLTCKPSPLMSKLKELSVNDPYSGFTATGGVITFTDSAWLMSFTCNRQPHFPDQPADVIVIWVYALLMDTSGNYVCKSMPQCTGKEVLTEMCYHLGLIDQLEEILAATKTRIALMPYITAQFMPRARGDRPDVVPEGCTNLAFMGQFVETHNDVVFTLESSVRTARIGVYSLLDIPKQVPDIYPGQYDIRRMLRAARTLNNDEPFLGEGLLRWILGGTYFEHILPLGPKEDAAQVQEPGLIEQQLKAIRGLIEKQHTLDEAKSWLHRTLGKIRRRR
tara:strand:+ start:20936 stop:22951 length:2016 start_codon:yes stop_codon:yes gene_type:complete